MPPEASSSTEDFNDFFAAAAELQLATAKAGIDFWKAWIGQASKFADIAVDGIETVRNPKKSSDVVKKMTELSNENVDVFGRLATRAAKEFFDGFGRLTGSKSKPRAKTRAKKTGSKSKPRAKTRAKKTKKSAKARR